MLLALGSCASFLRSGADLPWVGIFGAVGLCMISPCHGWRMRGGRPQALEWWGFGLPFDVILPVFFRRISLDGFVMVRYREAVRIHQTEKGTSKSYHYLVELSGGKGDRIAADLGSMLDARQAAKRVCLFLDLPLSEESASGRVLTPAAELSISLRERLLMRGDEPREPSRPQECRFGPRFGMDGIQVDIPRPPVGWNCKAIGVLGLALAAGLGAVLCQAGPAAPRAFPWAGVPLLLCLSWAHALLRRDRIRVSSAELSVEARLFGLLPLRTRISTAELELLEEVNQGTGWVQDFGAGGPCLRAASPRAFVEFGWGLSEGERAYLKDLLYYYATS